MELPLGVTNVRGALSTAASDAPPMPARLATPAEQPAPRPTYTAEELGFLLHRERARSERLGHEFAIVLFEEPLGWIDPVVGKRLASLMAGHLRITDDFGWYDTRRMCAILPGTNAEGAHRLAERAGEALADEGLHLTRSIYIYPSRWFGATPMGHHPQPRDDSRRDDSVGGDGSNGGGGHSCDPSVNGSRGRIEAALAQVLRKPSVPAQGLEQAFAKPLPRWKRALDVLGAGLLLMLFSPVFLVAAVAVATTSRGPVIFTQERAGLGGRPFRMYKFRTMVPDAEQQQEVLRPLSEQDGPAFKLSNDPRITAVGRVLRKTSIDELPQLVNVLKGDMSLVGPRPLPCRESDDCQQWHRARLDVTPGLTCIWQVNGRSNTNFDRWVRMDLEYIRKRSVWFDVKLILKTVPAVLLQRGAR